MERKWRPRGRGHGANARKKLFCFTVKGRDRDNKPTSVQRGEGLRKRRRSPFGKSLEKGEEEKKWVPFFQSGGKGGK